MILVDTPVEWYKIGRRKVWVKREDLCCPGGPPFSKMRGVYERLVALKARGVQTVGYVETSISMAGWGVAWLGNRLGLKVIIYDPQYKTEQRVLEFHRHKWAESFAEARPIKAGRARVNFYLARRELAEEFGDEAELLSLGLPFEETITATAAEATGLQYRTVVVNVGSGTICAGLLRGLCKGTRLYGIMGRSGDLANKRAEIIKRAGAGALLFDRRLADRFTLINPGYEYAEAEPFPAPFPCNVYYDRKAWKWLNDHLSSMEGPVLFWNIGS